MELLPCIIFVNSQLYEMNDDVQVWGRGQVKYIFFFTFFFFTKCIRLTVLNVIKIVVFFF